jgi:hypothetical protein
MTHARRPGWSFCLITDGRRPERLREELDSIRALALSPSEIIIAGNVPAGLGDDVRIVHAPELAAAGRLGAMRNCACASAQYDTLVVADDDMIFHREFGEALREPVADWDVLCVRLLNPDGTRFWDWATIGGPRGHMLLDYDDTDAHVYVTGGLAVMRAAVHDAVPWDDARGFYQGEDVEWSSRLRAAGARIRFDARGRVTHQDARYTQTGRVMRFRQDLTSPERLGADIDATGIFREGIEGCRWMSSESTLTAPAAVPGRAFIRFTITSVAPALAREPFRVFVTLNGVAAGAVTFTGTQTYTLSLPLRADGPTQVTLTSERSVSGHEVGISDERPVSVLIHDAQLVAG